MDELHLRGAPRFLEGVFMKLVFLILAASLVVPARAASAQAHAAPGTTGI